MNLCYSTADAEDVNPIFRCACQLIEAYEDPNTVDISAVQAWMYRKISQHIESYQRVLLNGEVVGYFRLEDQCGQTELDDLYVLPQYRRRGIGTQVLQHCRQIAKYPIYFYVFQENHDAIRLYQRMGFRFANQVSQTRWIMSEKVDS